MNNRKVIVKKKEQYRKTLPSLNPISYEKPNRVIQFAYQLHRKLIFMVL